MACFWRYRWCSRGATVATTQFFRIRPHRFKAGAVRSRGSRARQQPRTVVAGAYTTDVAPLSKKALHDAAHCGAQPASRTGLQGAIPARAAYGRCACSITYRPAAEWTLDGVKGHAAVSGKTDNATSCAASEGETWSLVEGAHNSHQICHIEVRFLCSPRSFSRYMAP